MNRRAKEVVDMRCVSIVIGILFVACAASADGVDLRSSAAPGAKVPVPGSDPVPVRSGGERCGNATVIPSLPFEDIASTSSANDTYFWACPRAAGGGKDVVYKYTPTVNEAITIDLCGSYYDTKLYVFEGECSGAPIACSDDDCSGPNYPEPYLSYLLPVPVYAGITYYIVVDGDDATAHGTYDLKVSAYEGPFIFCPTGAQSENEPTCHDEYEDNYNGGCNGPDFEREFQPILPASGESSAVMCGESGNYWHEYTYNTRDTDWFVCYGNGSMMSVTLEAEFEANVWFISLSGGDSGCYGAAVSGGGPCLPFTPTTYEYYVVPEGDSVIVWVGPQDFTGNPCGIDYVLTMTGIGSGGVSTGVPGVTAEGGAVERTSWGAVKTLYR